MFLLPKVVQVGLWLAISPFNYTIHYGDYGCYFLLWIFILLFLFIGDICEYYDYACIYVAGEEGQGRQGYSQGHYHYTHGDSSYGYANGRRRRGGRDEVAPR